MRTPVRRKPGKQAIGKGLANAGESVFIRNSVELSETQKKFSKNSIICIRP